MHIYLPASENKVSEKKLVQAAAGPLPGIHGTVLLMDDEEMVRSVAGKMLEKIGFNVVYAASGEEAVKIYSDHYEKNRAFDAVIFDLTIPGGMGGKEAIEQILKIDPKVRAIVSSGYSNDPVMANYQQYGFREVITKPFRLNDLIEAIEKVIVVR